METAVSSTGSVVLRGPVAFRVRGQARQPYRAHCDRSLLDTSSQEVEYTLDQLEIVSRPLRGLK